jgi:chorismate mutase
MLKKRMNQARAAGLREGFAQDVYHLIHEESVKQQTQMMQSYSEKNKEKS